MLHAAAMLTGLFAVWLLLTEAWTSPLLLAAGAGASLLSTALALRFGGVRGAAQAPVMAWLSLARAGAVASGALATLRAALAADVTLKPALVRVRTRLFDDDARAALAKLASAAPGALAVESDADGLLVHVNNEDAVDAADLGRLEAQVAALAGRGTTT